MLLLVSLCGMCSPVFAQSFGSCNARMFMDQIPTNTSTLFNVNYAAAPFTLTSLGTSTTTTGRNGVGYNFTDFSDDLTDFDYDHKGWFLNMVGTY